MNTTKRNPLNSSERRAYREARERGNPARIAFDIATKDRGGPDVPIEHRSMFKRDGFDLIVSITYDEWATPEELGLGKFTSTWKEGATLDRKAEGYTVDRHCHPYFEPDYTYAMHRKDGDDHETARKYVLADLARAEGYPEEWHYVSVRVTASRKGVELGSSSVGGVDSDCGDRYMREIVDEQATEALSEAKDALADLCSCEDGDD